MNKVASTPVVMCVVTSGVLSIYMFAVISNVVDIEILYSSAGDQSCKYGSTCTVTFAIVKEMKAPVYLLYKLDDFYHNHRRYISSKSNKQFLGHSISAA